MDLALYKAAQPFSQKHLLTLQDWERGRDSSMPFFSGKTGQDDAKKRTEADLSGRKDACNDFCQIVYAHACFF